MRVVVWFTRNHAGLLAVFQYSTVLCVVLTVLYPLDVLKRRLQVQGHGEAQRRYKNGAHAAFIILKEEGIVGFYRGRTRESFE